MKQPLDKEAEELEGLAQDNEQDAVKDTTKILREEEKKHDEKEARRAEVLHTARQQPVVTYIRALAGLLEGKMLTVEMPEGWSFKVFPTDVGIVLELYYGTRMFRSGFKPSMEEKYDLNAVNVYCIRAENTIDRIMMKPVTNSPHGE